MAHLSYQPLSVKHVNRYLTPLAVLVVAPGLLFRASLPGPFRIGGWLLLATAIAINGLTASFISGRSGLIGTIRVYSNYAINVCLMMILYREWPPIWMLLLLTGLGVAVYQSYGHTRIVSLGLAATLLVSHWLHGGNDSADWAEAVVKGTSIVVLSLFVNRIPHVSGGATAV